MSNKVQPLVPVLIPAEIITKITDLKQDRKRDRDLSVEDIVRRLCEGYIRLREMAREELARREEIERSYREHPDDWDDAEVWQEVFEQMRKDD